MKEYKECINCIYINTESPCPCDSCEQNTPTNYTEAEFPEME